MSNRCGLVACLVWLCACGAQTEGAPSRTNGGDAGGGPGEPAVDGGAGGEPADGKDAGEPQGPAVDGGALDVPTDRGLQLTGCGLNTRWGGDEYCLEPPPPDQGFQVHIGPEDYDNPDPSYVLEPGQETNVNFPAVAGNSEEIYYYYRQYRMRPGSHHLIVYARDGSGGGGLTSEGRRLGGSQNSAKDVPHLNQVAPENEGVGIVLSAAAPLSVNLHYINTTDAPILQEAWVNFWYKDPDTVTEPAQEMFAPGGLAMAIQPGEHVTLGRYTCPVASDGRVLSLYGHVHANTLRFSAWRVRDGVREPIYEAFDWHEPTVLEFNSTIENRPADANSLQDGGWSGILDLKKNDVLEWECEVMNQTSGVLRFTNELYDGEMCILIGDTVGPSISCAHR